MGKSLFYPYITVSSGIVTTTHRVISYTYPSTLLRTGDAVGNRLSLATHAGVVNYEDERISTN